MNGYTSPDLAFDICKLGTNFRHSDEKYIGYTNKIITYFKQEPVQIKHRNLGNNL